MAPHTGVMTVSSRSILGPNAIETSIGDLGAEGQHCTELSSGGALGDESAHGDKSLAAWRADAHRPGLGVGIDGNGAGGITLGGE